MANTIMSAKNSFELGLIMDFAPDNTQANCLTSALNATLLTFNGNEMSLLNDMGNGRVETAFLPEGYIPVGTCEFGDIIYIVSYNPLIDKSLIGCFPSPERNISSEEIGKLDVKISAADFLEIDKAGNPTGELTASSSKKILYERKLNPGDKYIIYDKASKILENNNISDIGNTDHIFGRFPKLIKIHVVAIEDSGKINFLDSTVKWYDLNDRDYFINLLKENNTEIDLDSYRTLVSDAYSIFLSKVSGKLALFLELEKIDGFSCTYDIYSFPNNKIDDDVVGNDYDIYWNINWESSDYNINPKYIVLTESKWSSQNSNFAGKYFIYKDGKLNYDTTDESSRDYSEPLPIAYPEEDYYYVEITRSYRPEDSITYEEFKLKNYYYLELEKIKEIFEGNEISNNLTISRDNRGLPEPGNYYINVKYKYEDIYYTLDNKGNYKEATKITINDDIVNNYFKTGVYKYFTKFTGIPYYQMIDGNKVKIDNTNLIYHYEITPAMPYGLLRNLSIPGYIDFSKIGTGHIDITKWKYYNTENIATITLGIDAYVEENKGISEVVLDFYDNQGIAASYHILNKKSYSGTFTEYIPLNGSTSNYKLNSVNSDGEEYVHAGLLASLLDIEQNRANLVWLNDGNPEKVTEETAENIPLYLNDAGTLYSNILYGVKITIKYATLDALGNYVLNPDNRTFIRWFWTNTMFNEYYYTTNDFELLQPLLALDLNALYITTDKWLKILDIYKNDKYLETTLENINQGLEAIVQSVNLDETQDGNVQSEIVIGLQNTYNTFSVNRNALEYIDLTVTLGNSNIELSEYTINSLENINFEVAEGIDPISNNTNGLLSSDSTGKKLYELLKIDKEGVGKELWEDYKNYSNLYSINFSEGLALSNDTKEITYINSKGEEVSIDKKYYSANLKDDYTTKLVVPMTFVGIHYSKYYKEYTPVTKSLQLLKSLAGDSFDLSSLGLKLNEGNIYFLNVLALGSGDGAGDNAFRTGVTEFSSDDGQFNVLSEETSPIPNKNAKEGETSMVKNLNGKILLWKDLLEDGEYSTYFRDRCNDWVNLFIMGSKQHGGHHTGNIYIYDHNKKKVASGITSFRNHFCGGNWPYYIKAPSIEKLDNGGDKFLVGLIMKDRDGEPHMLNNMYVLSKLNNKLTLQFVYDKSNISSSPTISYIGNVIYSILCNLYVLKSSKEDYTLILPTNIIFLSDNTSIYTNDIIYSLTVNSKENLNELINILGCTYNEYLELVRTRMGEDNIESIHTKILLMDILKNIPIGFLFDYIEPSKILENSIDYNVAARRPDSLEPEPIKGNFEENRLYTFKYPKGELELANTINTYWVDSVKEESGKLIATFSKDEMCTNNNFSEIFSLKDGKLVLNAVSHGSYNLLGFNVENLENRGCIYGIIKSEYLTDFGKYI